MTRFSTRTSWDTTETAYAAALREARASGRRLYDLTLSNPTRCDFACDAEALLAPLANPQSLLYDPDPRGLFSAREAVAAYYAGHAAPISPDHLVLTTSTSESYSFLFRLLCDPGDEILVAQPSYPLFDFLADLDDVRLKPYPLFYDQGWSIDLAELERSLTPRTRAVLLVHPNNPTGHWTSAAERAALESLCVRHRLALIVDEVFLDYPLAPSPDAQTFARGPHPALTFVLSGLSKIAALPQMKAAWIAALGPAPARREALARLEIIADTFLSLSAPVQLALPAWLAHRAPIQAQIRHRTQANLATLRQLAADRPHDLHVIPVQAGWNAILALPACTAEPACAIRLLRDRSVLTHPGAFYGIPQSNRLVVSLLPPEPEFTAGILRTIAASDPVENLQGMDEPQ